LVVVIFGFVVVVFFFKQKTAYELGVRLVGSEICVRDRYDPKTEVWVWRKWELLEWSLVGVGANPDAYEISKVLQKGLIKSDEVKNYLSGELYRLEIEKAFDDQSAQITELKTLIETAKTANSNAELESLKAEIKSVKNTLKRSVGIAVPVRLDYEEIVNGAISRISGRKIK